MFMGEMCPRFTGMTNQNLPIVSHRGCRCQNCSRRAFHPWNGQLDNTWAEMTCWSVSAQALCFSELEVKRLILDRNWHAASFTDAHDCFKAANYPWRLSWISCGSELIGCFGVLLAAISPELPCSPSSSSQQSQAGTLEYSSPGATPTQPPPPPAAHSHHLPQRHVTPAPQAPPVSTTAAHRRKLLLLWWRLTSHESNAKPHATRNEAQNFSHTFHQTLHAHKTTKSTGIISGLSSHGQVAHSRHPSQQPPPPQQQQPQPPPHARQQQPQPQDRTVTSPGHFASSTTTSPAQPPAAAGGTMLVLQTQVPASSLTAPHNTGLTLSLHTYVSNLFWLLDFGFATPHRIIWLLDLGFTKLRTPHWLSEHLALGFLVHPRTASESRSSGTHGCSRTLGQEGHTIGKGLRVVVLSTSASRFVKQRKTVLKSESLSFSSQFLKYPITCVWNLIEVLLWLDSASWIVRFSGVPFITYEWYRSGWLEGSLSRWVIVGVEDRDAHSLSKATTVEWSFVRTPSLLREKSTYLFMDVHNPFDGTSCIWLRLVC